MRRLGSLVAVILAMLATFAPVQAQVVSTGYYRAANVDFFERVQLGDIEVTPIGVIRDRRCPDIRLCFRDNTLLISVILHDRGTMREVVLELGQPQQVPGGLLVLVDPGARPVRNGAIPLRKYSLDLRYIPIAELVEDRGS